MIFAELIGKGSEVGGGLVGDSWMGKEEGSIIVSRMRQPQGQRTTTVLSKHLLGIILCYEIESYCIRLTPLVNTVKKYSLTN